MITDQLIEQIIQMQNPTCVGLDTLFDYLPDEYKSTLKDKLISVYYVTELMKDETYEVYTKYDDHEFMVLAKNPVTNKDIFTAIFDFWAFCR